MVEECLGYFSAMVSPLLRVGGVLLGVSLAFVVVKVLIKAVKEVGRS